MKTQVKFPVVLLTLDNVKLLEQHGWELPIFASRATFGLLFPSSKTVSEHFDNISAAKVYLKHSELAGYLLINDRDIRIEYLTAIKEDHNAY